MLNDCFHHSPRWHSQNLSDCVLGWEDRFWVGIIGSPQFAARCAAVRRHCHVQEGAAGQAASLVDLVRHYGLVDRIHSVAIDVAEVSSCLGRADCPATGCHVGSLACHCAVQIHSEALPARSNALLSASWLAISVPCSSGQHCRNGRMNNP